ncbi:MAG: glycosyltransferase family 2 protein [Acidobacteria bacterium]|nr:glycosyltransferase family 2 protein [Acidobacteriota bacterium]
MLSVVVPTYRKKPRLRLMLTSLVSASREVAAEVEIVVVDDGSEDDVEATVEQATGRDSRAVVQVVKGEHRGRSVARNLGAKQAAHERVLFLDDDVLLTSQVLETHLRYAREQRPEFVRGTIFNLPWLVAFEDPESGALTERAARSLGLARGARAEGLRTRTIKLDAKGHVDSSLVALARTSRFEKDLHEWLASRPLEMSGRWVGATGAHLSVSRSAMMQLGGFDEAMGLRWGAEDLEFGYRAEKAGIQILHAREAVVYHMDHDSCGREGDHEAAFEYFARKHQDHKLLQLLAYFAGQRSLPEALAQ